MNHYQRFVFLLLVISSFFWSGDSISAQTTELSIAKSIAGKADMLERTPTTTLLTEVPAPNVVQEKMQGQLEQARYLKMETPAVAAILARPAEVLKLRLPNPTGNPIDLELERADIFSPDFKIYAASNRDVPVDYSGGAYYWGIVAGQPKSLAAISIIEGEVSGLIHIKGTTYNLGRIEGKNDDLHVIYRAEDLQQPPPADCFADDEEHYIGGGKDDQRITGHTKAADNCVKMYIEVDYDIFVGKGGVTQAADYITAVFNQVSILYANEAISLVINEVVVWDVQDPYTGTSTSNYLTQFRNYINGNYNGDLAHLVGYNGGGGIAYLNVLCNSFYGVGYSDVNPRYNDVPTYSWTVEVLTHEIGHNLGSNHTHACVWNDNNTPIDGCGPAAGYSEGCDGPVPAAGTIMSYCHLVSGVGIDFNLGFGPQPGDLIRSRVYNASCLEACGAPTADDAGITAIMAPEGTICTGTATPSVELTNFGTTSLTSVTINYEVDGSPAGSYNWMGNLNIGASTTVTLSPITFDEGGHFFTASTDGPNGATDEDPTNDAATSNFTRGVERLYYADSDGDGFGDPNVSVLDCVAPSGYVDNATDCNDNNGNAYPGAPCNDGDACTTNDVLDADCNCSGTIADADGDGVCDAEDVCPGGDDTQDSDGDGIPNDCDCVAFTGDFAAPQLTHSGSGSSEMTYVFETGSKDASFMITDMQSITNGGPSRRYAEVVDITYIDGNGTERTYTSANDGNSGLLNVNISGGIESVTVRLYDGYDGNAPGQLSVNLSTIDYCGPTPDCPDADGDGVCDAEDACPGENDYLIGTPCDDNDDCTIDDVIGPDCQCAGTPTADSDGDGVCDAQDMCPGGDDRIDSDGDGIPDDCDASGCITSSTTNFSSETLTHSGIGSSSTTVTFDGTHSGISFTIEDIDAKEGGKPVMRYIESVTVTYQDATDNTVTYGTFSGNQVNSVTIDIPEVVLSITVSLADSYDGNSESNMSITLGQINSCAAFPENLRSTPKVSSVSLYPNPTTGQALLGFGETLDEGQVIIRNLLGAQVATYQIREQAALLLNTEEWAGNSQVYLITVYRPDGESETKRLIITR